MFSRIVCCALFVAFSAGAAAATKPAPKHAEAKPAAPQRLKGKTETLACRLGTEDRHARIAVVLIGGKTDSFAYYSKWKPRTCSIYLQRWRDSYSKWADNGPLTTVDLERGAFLIEHKKGEYHFIFRNIDRERYCGMDGTINGGLTIRKGSEQCELDGDIMVEGTPLGQAFANREEDKVPSDLMPDLGAGAKSAPTDSPSRATESAAKAPAEAAAKSGPVETAAKPTAAIPQAKPAAVEAVQKPPVTETAQKPAAADPAQKAAAAVATESVAKPAAAAATEPAAKPAAQAAAQPAPEKKAEESSGNPFTGFFRSLARERPAEQTPSP